MFKKTYNYNYNQLHTTIYASSVHMLMFSSASLCPQDFAFQRENVDSVAWKSVESFQHPFR